MADESISDGSGIRQQLTRLERRARLVTLVNGLSLAAMLVAGLIALGLLTDAVWNVPMPVRIGLLIAAGTVAVVGIAWAVGRALLRRSDPAAVAALVEAAYPQLKERLSSAIEWERDAGAAGSPLMRAIVVEQAGRSLANLDLSAPVPLSRASRRGALGAAALVALLAPCLFFGGYRLMLHRFAMPWKNLERSANLYLDVTPGDASVARGADVEITAEPRWRIARTEVDRAALLWRDQSGRRFERQMTWHADRELFVATIANVLEPFHFEIDAGQARSRAFHIDVVDRPLLTAVTAIIEPPGYAGRAVEQLTGAVGELEMLRDSRVLLQLQFSLPVERVALQWTPDAAPAPEAVEFAATIGGDGLSAEVSLTPEHSGRFAFQTFDALGPVDLREPQRRIRLIDDAPPLVRFANRASSSRAAPRDVLRLPVLAGDGIGLAALELHYQVVDRAESDGQIDAGVPLLGVRSIEHEFVFDLTPLALTEGAVLAVRARAADERADPGPNESWTEQRLISITEQAAAYESEPLAQRQQQLFQSLQRLRAAVDQNLTSAETLRSDAAARQEAGTAFERAPEIADLAAANAATVADAERLAAQMELHPLLSPLGERTRSVGRQQLASAAEQATAARSSPPVQKSPLLATAVEQLTQAKVELAAIQRDLEHLAELEQDLLELQRLADDTNRLAKDVAGLKQSTERAGDTEPAEPGVEERIRRLAADRLRANHAELTERLDDLVERRPELLDAAVEHHLEHLAALRDRALQMAERERQLAAAMESETESADSTSETPDAEQLSELATRQTQLIKQAVDQALAAAESTIGNPTELADVAAQAAAAAEAMASGDLNAAAGSARQAAERAGAAAEASDVNSEALRKLADEQAQIAEQLAAAAGSAAARAAARQASQQRLAAGAQQLEQEFQQVAEQLTNDPLQRADDGARATNSGTATRQAHDFMTSASTAQSSNDLPAAAAAAKEAVKQLEAAAEQALAATSAAPDSPVPTEVGHQVAQASQQLRRAGEQLAGHQERGSEAGSQEGAEQAAHEAADGESPESADGEQSKSESADGQPPGEGSDEASDAQSSGDDLAQAAASLQAAAQRLKPRESGQRPSPSESAAGKQPGTSPESDAAAEGSGSTETAQLAELAEKIKARATRNWGELPGELRSELQQRMQTRPDADYAPLIRMYFDEISRRPSPTPPDSK